MVIFAASAAACPADNSVIIVVMRVSVVRGRLSFCLLFVVQFFFMGDIHVIHLHMGLCFLLVIWWVQMHLASKWRWIYRMCILQDLECLQKQKKMSRLYHYSFLGEIFIGQLWHILGFCHSLERQFPSQFWSCHVLYFPASVFVIAQEFERYVWNLAELWEMIKFLLLLHLLNDCLNLCIVTNWTCLSNDNSYTVELICICTTIPMIWWQLNKYLVVCGNRDSSACLFIFCLTT